MSTGESPATADAAQLSAEQILNLLQRHVWLVSLQCGWPKLNYEIASADVTVDGTTIPEKFRSNPGWKLIPEVWKTKLASLERQARKTLQTSSSYCQGASAYLLPIAKAEDVFGELRNIRTEFTKIGDDFVAHYSEILRSIRNELDAHIWEPLSKKVPKESEVREKFYMRWPILPLARDHDADTLSACKEVLEAVVEAHPDFAWRARGVLRMLNRQGNELVEDELAALTVVKEAQAQTQKLLMNDLVSMAQEPRQRILDACRNMVQSIAEERVIRTATLAQVTRACEFAATFSFMLPPELVEIAEQVRLQISQLTPQELNAQRDRALAIAGQLEALTRVAAAPPAEDPSEMIVRRSRRVAIEE